MFRLACKEAWVCKWAYQGRCRGPKADAWLRGAQVGGVDLVHHPSEAEQVLRLLPAQLRALRALPPAAGASLGFPG